MADLPSSSTRGARRDDLFAVVACAALAVFYAMALPPISFGVLWSDDGMYYARWLVERDLRELAHPHHALYHPLALATYDLAVPWAGRGIATALRVSTAWSALGGALSVFFLWRTARALGWSAAGAAALAFALGLSHAHWAFSSVPETYLPSQAALWFVVWHAVRRGSPAGGARLAVPIVGLALAWALRADAAAFLLPYGAALVAARGWRAGLRGAAWTASFAALLALGVHLAVWGTWVAPQPGFATWLRGYGARGYGSFEGWATGRLPEELRGIASAVLDPESAWTTGAALVCASLAALAWRARAVPGLRPLAWLAALHLGWRIAFYAWWEPGQFDFGAGHASALALVLCVAFAGARGHLQVATTLALLAYVGWQAVELATHRLPRYRDRSEVERIAALDRALLPGDVIAGDSRWIRIGFRAWTERTVLTLHPDTFLDELDAWLTSPSARPVVVPADELEALLLRPQWSGRALSLEERAERVRRWDAFFREHPPVAPVGRDGPLPANPDGTPSVLRFVPRAGEGEGR